MEWMYKNIKIVVYSDGSFIFRFNDSEYKYYSLKEAKCEIDSLTADYYTFTQKDMDNLMKKLTKREKELVRSLYQEIGAHRNNAYCEMGILEDCWNWEWDFNK